MPVLLAEVLQNLNCSNGSNIVDCTLGGAGHAEAILDIIKPEGFLLGIDADFTAVEAAKIHLARFSQHFILERYNFRDLDKAMDKHGMRKADGFLFDLGLSSPQIDDPDRGFSYMVDAKLDMRIDDRSDLTAEFVLNNYEKVELKKIILSYGGEKWASRVAENIVKSREKEKIRTSGQLVDIIDKAIPNSARQRGGHSGKRTFQAIRMEVNQELSNIKIALEKVIDRLETGGRVAIISYHSLEDKIVKNWMKKEELDCVCPPDIPVCVCDKEARLSRVTRKPIRPTEEELKRNPRSRSAKLRVAQRV